MRHPDMRPNTDEHGFLYDPAIRRALTEMGTGIPTEPLEAMTAVRLASKRMQDRFRTWTEGHGLSESRFQVLVAIYHSPERRLHLGALAERLNVVPRTITDVIDVLERDGLVRRVSDPEDRRSTHAQLTEAGEERISAIQRSAVTQQADLTRGLTAEQLVQLRHLCLLLVQNLNSQPGGA